MLMDPSKPQYSIDYLDQIAPKQSSTIGNNKLFFGIIGLGIIVVIAFAILLVVGVGGPSQTSRLQSLAAQLQSMQTISTNAQADITDNHLQTINANLNIQLTNINQNIAAPYANSAVNPKNIPPAIKSEESLSGVTAKLADAKLNAVYDRVYANEMSYQLSDVFIVMREINNGTKSKSMHDFLNTTYNNLQPIATQLSNFTDANG